MIGRRKFYFWLAMIAVPCRSVGAEEGLSTTFADVQVYDVPLGKPARVRDVHGPDLVLQNRGSHALRIQGDVMVPAEKDLRGGAEPIPDANWIRVSPNSVLIPPRQSVS